MQFYNDRDSIIRKVDTIWSNIELKEKKIKQAFKAPAQIFPNDYSKMNNHNIYIRVKYETV